MRLKPESNDELEIKVSIKQKGMPIKTLTFIETTLEESTQKIKEILSKVYINPIDKTSCAIVFREYKNKRFLESKHITIKGLKQEEIVDVIISFI